MLIATCGTTLVVGKQEWSVLDADGHRIKISKPMCDVDELYSLAQPGVDVHNKLRQKSLAVEKSWGTRVCLFFCFKCFIYFYIIPCLYLYNLCMQSYEQRAHATAAGVMCVDGFNICRTMTPEGKKYGADSLMLYTERLIYQLLNNAYRSEKLQKTSIHGNAKYSQHHDYEPSSAYAAVTPAVHTVLTTPPPRRHGACYASRWFWSFTSHGRVQEYAVSNTPADVVQDVQETKS